ncbi:MAG: NADH-quinone oxidoreductase subunit NuoE [Verrucomicrobia bacterium]|nr:NADH-quinone oxidoreductase subunit NuoE [Verrucomicrobiota bacterium]
MTSASSTVEVDLSHLDRVLAKFPEPGSSDVIPLLQAVQETYGYLPREAIELLSKRTRIPLTQIYGVATFYAQFSFTPRGRHMVRPCRGTACHVRGAKRIVSSVQKHLGVEEGGTTKDLKFSFETVACLGTCFLSPVMMVDDRFYGNLSPEKATKILDKCK